MSVEVRILPHEEHMGASVGIDRRNESIVGSYKSANLENLYENDIQSACAEVAVAKLFGIYWDGGVNTFKEDDVLGLQVRQTRLPDGSLIIRAADKDESLYVLATGIAPVFTARGAMYGADAKRDEFLRAPCDREPAWFVPQERLLGLDRVWEHVETVRASLYLPTYLPPGPRF